MKKILILESNETFAEELSSHFSRAGYEVCGVTGDGGEGLALLEKCAPGVVVTSLLLTTLDGFTVMERAKKAGNKADFIVLGNFTDDKIINRAIALGARYYLVKPVSAAIVEERVAEVSEETPEPVRERTITQVPIYRNKITRYTGTLYTGGETLTNFILDLDTEWGETIEHPLDEIGE